MLNSPQNLTRLTTLAVDDATAAARYYEYTKAADPIGNNLIPGIPYHTFLPELYASGPTRVIPLDLTDELQTEGPATGPGVCAHFVRILPFEQIELAPNATSLVFFVMRGGARLVQGEREFDIEAGSFVALPGGQPVTLTAASLTTLYYVNDAPLLRYLGATSTTPKFAPTYYPAERALEELRNVAAQPGAAGRSRISVLLGNARFPQTRTVTHTLWAMYGLLPARAEQKPHRHQSIALDFIVRAPSGCYTLVGTKLATDGRILNPMRVDWVSGMAFVTPPGYWHAHYNESDEEAFLIPIQDAGLHTYLRSLDIRFQS